MIRSRRFYRRQFLLTWFVVALLVFLQVELLPRFSVNDSTVMTANSDKAAVSAQYASLPLVFEPNQGQVDGNVSYLVHHGQATTYFDGVNTITTVGDDHITMSLDGANTPSFTGTDQLESKTNYFIGNDQSKWHSDIPNYKSLSVQNVYPGIDLKYYGTNSELEHDFIVNPGSDYHQIAFHFDGQQDVSLDNDGNLILKTASDELHLNAPTTYQQDAHSKHTIPSQFELNDTTVTVAMNGEYDHSQPLIIDPTLSLVYSTYLGGSGNDIGQGIAVDASGNVYVAGYTTSINFPTASPYQASASGSMDAFIAKLNPAGTALIYSTYLGGSTGTTETSRELKVDTAGNVYVTGGTDAADFPLVSPFQTTYGGGALDIYVAKLNASGSALIYSTYLGGSSVDSSNGGIEIDTAGNAYITGFTTSSNFPTASAFDSSYNGGGSNGDAFVAKLAPTGSTLVYSTYIGGSGDDNGAGIALDTSGNVYIAGSTQSSNFPTSAPFQASNAGGSFDGFALKLNAAGSALTYSTYLGGTGADNPRDIDIDSSNNAYVTGQTASTNFPTSAPFQASRAGVGATFDAFITKFNAAGSALTYSTYLGGDGQDLARGIAIDAAGDALITGNTSSDDFPSQSAIRSTTTDNADAFVAKMNPAGSALVYSTYLGGDAGADIGSRVVVGLSGNAYVVGQTAAADFPIASAFQSTNAGGSNDAFITQLSDHTVDLTATVNPTLTFTVGSASCALGALSVSQTQFCTYSLTAATNGASGYAISYLPVVTLTSGVNTITALSSQTASTLAVEQFGINLRANTTVGSHTASTFGANVSGGSGAVASAYNTPDSFKLVVAGDTIATVGSPSLTSIYTVSTIANISSTTEAGAYTTTLTYNIVAGY